MSITGSKTYVEINGVDVTDYVAWYEVTDSIREEIGEAKIFLGINVTDVIDIKNNDSVIIKRGKVTGGEHYLFRGNVSLKSPKGMGFEVTAKNKLWQLQRREVTELYESSGSTGGVISEIAKDLIETYGGLTADVEDSGSEFVFSRFPCIRDKVLERLQKLRRILNWVLRYDPENDKVVFKNKGTELGSQILRINYDGTTNVGRVPKWDWDTEDIINSVTVVGAPVLEWRKETFNGDGSTKEFALSKTPEIVEVEVNGTRQVMGVADGTSGSYDFVVDKENKKIIFETAPGSGTDNVVVNYAIHVSITVTRRDENSIADYDLSEDTFVYPDIRTVADAELKAQELLDRFSQPTPTTNQLPVEQTDEPIRAGQTLRVEDNINNVTTSLVVIRIAYRWPDIYDVIDIGQEPVMERRTIQDIEDRISKLEKIEARNIDFINRVVYLRDDVRCRAELEVQERDVSYDGAWGIGFGDGTTKKTYAWGESGGKWQDTYTNTPVTVSICHQDNQYEEEFVDTRFVISDETTATVDTANNEVRF